ncbi:hypothetical protein BO71DRAFT_427723 [Aspergillus ellipticus CBS 707.79]|uniref:Uncharacterized protein n=1 Tax=Aspergillus ellipticus CBS 707.79 TaxID=1448320 RepID=A0A319DH72_9EURO|nr:hypothetical protein BO71DRAFT_427723 [Aspergillus ellipticus CBS 707.79]
MDAGKNKAGRECIASCKSDDAGEGWILKVLRRAGSMESTAEDVEVRGFRLGETGKAGIVGMMHGRPLAGAPTNARGPLPDSDSGYSLLPLVLLPQNAAGEESDGLSLQSPVSSLQPPASSFQPPPPGDWGYAPNRSQFLVSKRPECDPTRLQRAGTKDGDDPLKGASGGEAFIGSHPPYPARCSRLPELEVTRLLQCYVKSTSDRHKHQSQPQRVSSLEPRACRPLWHMKAPGKCCMQGY